MTPAEPESSPPKLQTLTAAVAVVPALGIAQQAVCLFLYSCLLSWRSPHICGLPSLLQSACHLAGSWQTLTGGPAPQAIKHFHALLIMPVLFFLSWFMLS